MSEEEQSPKQEPKPSGLTSFWKELRRRKVVRVAMVYAVVGWLVIQVAVSTFPRLSIPGWAESLVIMLVVLGFPISLVVAWAFELTPEGIKSDAGVGTGESVAPAKGQKHNYITMALVVLVLTFLVVDRYVFDASKGQNLPSGVSTSGDRPILAGTIQLPESAPMGFGVTVGGLDYNLIALSPDSTWLVYVGRSETGSQLYRKGLESFNEPEPIPGTDGALSVRFSPDGQNLAFLTEKRLKRVSIKGDDIRTLASTKVAYRVFWPEADWIYFANNEGLELWRVSASGGEPEHILGDIPRFKCTDILPNSSMALAHQKMHSVNGDYAEIFLCDLSTGKIKSLGISGFEPRWLSTGHILFGRSGNLMAVRFDEQQGLVQGDPVALQKGVSMESIFTFLQIAISKNGTLAFVPGQDRGIGTLVTIDRLGNESHFVGTPPLHYGLLDVSKNSESLAVHIGDVEDYIWIYDMKRQEGRKLVGSEGFGWPQWSPNGKSLAMSSNYDAKEGYRIAVRSFDDTSSKVIYRTLDEYIRVSDWAPHMDLLAFAQTTTSFNKLGFISSDGMDITWWDDQPESGLWGLWGDVFSPDGKWIAYCSNETGPYEVWIRSYPDGTVRRQISVNGGLEPVWSPSGELFYRTGNQVWSIKVQVEPELEIETAQLAFTVKNFKDTGGRSFDVSSDGQTLYAVQSPVVIDDRIHVIGNWFEELNRLVPITE